MRNEDEEKELQTLQEGLDYLNKALACFVCCENVTEKEYQDLCEIADMLNDRKIELQIKIDGCIIEEV